MIKIRWGIIGPGSISERFASVLQTEKDAVLAGVVSASNPDKARLFADKFGFDQVYSSYQEMLSDPAIDVVYIGLTHNFHYEAIRQCLISGKPVICEKPLTISRRQAEEVTALSRQKKVLLMEAMWTRCLPAFIQAKKWVSEKKIGEVKWVQASFSFHFPYDPKHRLYNPDLAGGSLYDAGVYPIEFASGILDENPFEVNGVLTNAPNGVDEFAAFSLKYPSGALASLSCGMTTKTSWDAYVYGSEGYLVVYDFLMSKKCERFDLEGQLLESFQDDFEDGFIYQIRHFSSLFRDGRTESDLIPLNDNIACAEVFDEVLKKTR